MLFPTNQHQQKGSLELLEELQLAHNRLQGTPATMAGLQRLQRLDLRYNQLTQPPQVSRTNLAEVSLGFNRLQTLGTMDWAPRNIKVLDVRDNKLRDLPPECALFKLERLDVTNNDLSSLPSGLGWSCTRPVSCVPCAPGGTYST